MNLSNGRIYKTPQERADDEQVFSQIDSMITSWTAKDNNVCDKGGEHKIPPRTVYATGLTSQGKFEYGMCGKCGLLCEVKVDKYYFE